MVKLNRRNVREYGIVVVLPTAKSQKILPFSDSLHYLKEVAASQRYLLPVSDGMVAVLASNFE